MSEKKSDIVKRMSFFLLFGFILLIVGFSFLMVDLRRKELNPNSMLRKAHLVLNGKTIPVEVADQSWSRARGLSGRDSLDDESGMYFVFGTSTIQRFWMNRMKFSIDMIFIQGDTIVSVSSSVPFPRGMEIPAIVSSGVPADRVLELNAGKAEAWGLKEGTKVQLVETVDSL